MCVRVLATACGGLDMGQMLYRHVQPCRQAASATHSSTDAAIASLTYTCTTLHVDTHAHRSLAAWYSGAMSGRMRKPPVMPARSRTSRISSAACSGRPWGEPPVRTTERAARGLAIGYMQVSTKQVLPLPPLPSLGQSLNCKWLMRSWCNFRGPTRAHLCTIPYPTRGSCPRWPPPVSAPCRSGYSQEGQAGS